MRYPFLYLAAYVLLGITAPAQSTDSPAEQWFRKNGLFGIPAIQQPLAQPGMLIAFLPNGGVYWEHPTDVVSPVSVPFTIRESELDSAVQVGVLAKFLTLGIAGKFKHSNTLAIQQAEFLGSGYDQVVREKVILQPGTSTVKLFESLQDEWDKVNRELPVYLIQAVYTTANLEVTGAKNTDFGASVNSDAAGTCTAVTVPSTDDKNAPKEKKSGPSSDDTDSSAEQSGTPTSVSGKAASVSGGSMSLCLGKGGKDVLKGTKQVPVAMSVCNVYYWAGDKSWNCRPLNDHIKNSIDFTP